MDDVQELDVGVILLAAYHTPPCRFGINREYLGNWMQRYTLTADSSAIKPPRNDKTYKTYTCG
jgi:hypothetical protein